LDDGRLDGGSVTWRRWYELPAREGSGAAVDVLVSWRNAEGATLLPSARSRYVWLQDIIEHHEAYDQAFSAKLSGIFLLSRFHARGLPEHAASKVVLTSNGIDAASLVPPGPNHHWRFMYAAWPTAGLEPLLERWPQIRSAIAKSSLGKARGGELGGASRAPTLAVYYGFPKWLEEMHAGEEWYTPSWRAIESQPAM